MNALFDISLRDNATEALSDRIAKLRAEALAKLLSEPYRVFWRERLKSLGRNKRGWPSTGFWESAARAVVAIVNGATLILRCEKQGVEQRYRGGPIKPVKAGALTIPISPVSYGHRASEFPGLFLLKTAKGAYLVQRGEAVSERTGSLIRGSRLGGNASRRLRASLIFLFKLSGGVEQQGDPRVVPTEDEFTEVGLAVVERSFPA